MEYIYKTRAREREREGTHAYIHIYVYDDASRSLTGSVVVGVVEEHGRDNVLKEAILIRRKLMMEKRVVNVVVV